MSRFVKTSFLAVGVDATAFVLQGPPLDVDIGSVLDIGGGLPLVSPHHVKAGSIWIIRGSFEAYAETTDSSKKLYNPHGTNGQSMVNEDADR